MAGSKVNLGAGAPEGYSFGISGYGVRPRVFVEGSHTGSTPSVTLPKGKGDVLLDVSNQNYYGKIGVDVTSPGGDTFGGAVDGSYYRGSVDFPEELQRYGAPRRETYSAHGIQSPKYSGYYQTKGGTRFEGYYRDSSEGSGIPNEYGGRVSYTTSFEEGGPVSAGLGSLPASENILTSGSISMSPSKYPNVDSRTAALGSQLLKKAGSQGDFGTLLDNANPKVISQINRIRALPEEKGLRPPPGGISLFMGKTA